MTLYSEVETVVSEEAHIDLPVLPGQTSVNKCGNVPFFTQTNKQTKKLQLEQSIDPQFSWYNTVFHYDSSLTHVDCGEEYRQAGRVGVLQKGLKDNSKVFLEETASVQQLLEFLLRTEMTQKNKVSPVLFVLKSIGNVWIHAAVRTLQCWMRQLSIVQTFHTVRERELTGMDKTQANVKRNSSI